MKLNQLAAELIKAHEARNNVEIYGVALQLMKLNDKAEAIRTEIEKKAQATRAELEPLWLANEDDDYSEDYDDTVTRLTLEGYENALNDILELLNN